MNEVKVSFDNCRNRLKPNSYNARSIKERAAERIHRVNQNKLKSFVTLIGRDGCSFSPATFKTSFTDIDMSRDNFRQMQMFVLDFNGGILLEEVMSRANQYDLPILFAYETFSSKDQNKFRVVFLNDVSIKHAKVAEIIIEALLTIFPEADPRSRDISQFYFGGKRLLYFDNEARTINVELLIRNMCLYLKDRYGDKNYRRNIYQFSHRTGLVLNEKKYLDVSVIESSDAEKLAHIDETLSPNSIIYIIDIGDKSSSLIIDRSNISSTDHLTTQITKLSYRIVVNQSFNGSSKKHCFPSSTKSSEVHLPHRSYDLQDIGAECRLINKFIDGTRILTQDELRGIATSLIRVESGSKKFMQTIRKHSYFDDNPKRYDDWEFYLSYMKKTKHIHLPCDRFCSYRDQCHHAKDILSTSKPEKHTTKKLANCDRQFYPVNEAAADFNQIFEKVLAAGISTMHKNIYVINAPTGIGKSTTVRNYLKKNPERKYLIAFPTNDLKNEAYENAVKQGIKAVKSPSLLEDKDKLPTKVWNHIQGLYKTGKHHAVLDYIKGVIAKRNANKESLDILKNYLCDMVEFFNSDCHAFTTHSMVSTMDYWTQKRYDAVIFDEDPILNCMITNQVEIPISKLKKVLEEINSTYKLAEKIRAAAEAAASDPWITLPTIPYEEAYNGISTAIDIPSFCLAQKFYFKKKADDNNSYTNSAKEDCLVFYKPFNLNPRIKYIILSATADHTIYNYVFGSNRVNYYECKKARYIGTLNQYTHYTVSHDFVKKNPDIVSKMIKMGGSANIITFKDEEYAMDSCHFGKTTGIDTFKGKELTVLGTYNRPDWLYKLFPHTIGGDSFNNYKEAVMRYQPVRHNGFKFHFMTFDETALMLRNIQFWMIESELEQAIGRARLSRCNCNVNLFSNFPLSQANIIDTDFSKV